jgi:outer membrane biosynthesis protein TonB
MTAGWTISAILHALVLVISVIAFVIRPLSTPPQEFLATDIISATDFTQLTNGAKTAPKADTPKPLVEKVAEAKPVEDNPASKIVDKPEVVAAADQPQPPKPEPEKKKPDPKPPTPQPQPQKSEPKQAFAKDPEPKIDPIAEALKKEVKKPDPKTQKKTETPTPQKKAEPQKPQPTFDRTKIAALLDKRDPQRRAITGSTLNNTPALGTATGNAVTLSQNELDALRARLRDCWNVPVGLAEARDLVVTVRIQFKQDGSLLAEPRLMNSGSHPAFQAASESALRAVRTCAPYTFLPVAKYEAWKDVIVDFDPRDMFRG